MHKQIPYLLAACLLTAISLMAPAPVQAEADAAKPPFEPAKKEKKAVRNSFSGKLAAIDLTTMSLTIGGNTKSRTIYVTSHTRITKAGKPAILADAVVGEEIAGQAAKNAASHEEAVSLRLGSKPDSKPKAKPAKKPENPKKD